MRGSEEAVQSKAYIKNVDTFINENMNDGKDEGILNTFEKVIKETGANGVTLSELARSYNIKRLGLLANNRKNYLQTLKEDGIVVEVLRKTAKKPAKVFLHSSFSRP